MIVKREYTLTPGATSVFHFTFRRVKILGVARGSDVLTIISGLSVPSNMEVSYLGIGRLRTDPNNPYLAGEKMWVLYEF